MRDDVVFGLQNDNLGMIWATKQRRVISEHCEEDDWTNSSAEEDRWRVIGHSSAVLPPGRAVSVE